MRHDVVPSCHDPFHFMFAQIVLCFLRELVSIQSFELFEQISVATDQILRAPQGLVGPERASEIYPVEFLVITNQHVGKVGIGIVD